MSTVATKKEKKEIKLRFKKISLEGYNSVEYEEIEGFTVSDSPLHNCQLFTIGGFENLKASRFTNKDRYEIVKRMFEQVSKNMALVDVYANFNFNFYTKEVDDAIVMESPYTSSNGSRRKIVIIRAPDNVFDGSFDEDDYDDDEDYDEDYY